MTDYTWIGSLNVHQFVLQQMEREGAIIDKNAEDQLKALSKRQTTYKTQQAAYTQLQTLLATFNQSLTSLNTSFNSTYQFGYSTTGIATASVNGTVTPGLHTLSVTKLAKANSVASTNVFSSTTSEFKATGSLQFTIGAGSPITVNIGATDTLQSAVTKINTAAQVNHVGLTASIVSTTSGQYQLVVAANQTGIANKVNITETGTIFNISNGVGGTGTTLTTEDDADFTFDNLHFVQASNSVTAQGMNLSLLNTGSTNISVTPNTQSSSVVTALQGVADAYNQVITLIQKSQGQIDATDPNMATVLSLLKGQMNSAFSGSSAYSVLREIGVLPSQQATTIEIQLPNDAGTAISYVTGLLQIDTKILNHALGTNFDGVKSMLTDANAGIFANMQNKVLAANSGTVWIAMNDASSGGIPVTSRNLDKITNQLTDMQAKIAQSKKDLLQKYAQLEVSLSAMQNTSIYLSQLMAASSH